jgi:hypothetical protein
MNQPALGTLPHDHGTSDYLELLRRWRTWEHLTPMCSFIHKPRTRLPVPSGRWNMLLNFCGLYQPNGIAYLRARQATKRACCLHPSVSANRCPSAAWWKPGWAHELNMTANRLQIHVRDGRLRLYTTNGVDWSKQYPLTTEAAARIDGSAIIDAEVWLGSDGAAISTRCYSRVNDQSRSARLRPDVARR